MPVSTNQAGQGTEPWGDLCGCFGDCSGCIYYCCCPCCVICDIGNLIGPDVLVGQKNEPAHMFTDCPSQCLNCITWGLLDGVAMGLPIGLLFGLCMCYDKTCCLYDANILRAAAVKMNKNKVSPGPCQDPCLQMCCCCGHCTYCLMYKELKAFVAKGGVTTGPAGTELPGVGSMDRAGAPPVVQAVAVPVEAAEVVPEGEKLKA